MKWILNKKGSVLQLVLVTFLVLTTSLLMCLTTMTFHVNNHHIIQLLMKQKNIEIMSVYHFVYQMQNDILISDEYSDDDYEIVYYVDDLGSYYEIHTTVTSQEMNYSFLTQIDTNTYEVIKFEYKE